jgi:hypothetical protein
VNELAKMWQEVVMLYFEAPAWHLPESPMEDLKNFKLVSVLAEF